MKKLILMLLFIGFFSDASFVCTVTIVDRDWYDTEMHIKENCKKGDILSVTSDSDNILFQEQDLLIFLGRFCRFDREIISRKLGVMEILFCELNDNLKRRSRPEKTFKPMG